MTNRVAIYPCELGLVVIVHADGAVWTKHYEHDLQAILDLHEVHLFNPSATSSFLGDFSLPDVFDTVPLQESGFYRSVEIVH